MKKLIYFIPVMALAFISCGGGEAGTSEEGNAEATETEMTGKTIDLSEYGMDFTIVVPDKANLQTEVIATDWGGVEIIQGENFMLSIAYGEGDLDLLKFDLGEDLVYKSEILEDSPDHLLYKRSIEGADVVPEHHFLYVLKIDGDAVEVQNSKDASFSEEAARAMLKSAMSLKVKSAS
jgi:hypothetical protein